jgi:hypothetical protein
MTTHEISYALSPKDVTALARAIIQSADAETAGRITYMKSLLARVQVEIHGKPVLRALRANQKPPTPEAALEAFERVQAIYYEAVLAALPDGLTPIERQAKTSFARSAASTLRRAIKLGWNPLTPLTEASKVTLRRWIDEHAAPTPVTPARAERRVTHYVEAISDMLRALPKDDSARLREAVLAELGAPPPQRMRDVSLRRHAPAEPRAH